MILRPKTHLLQVTCPLLFLAIVLADEFGARQTAEADEKAEQLATDVFISGTEGYHTFRIPSLIVTAKGTLLAFCEGRKTGRADDGDIDLVLRRSTDAGNTWLPMQVVYEEGGTASITIGNPCPVLDKTTGTMWLTFCRNNDDVFVTSTEDDGLTWAPPRKITAEVKEPDWGWYATGPGVGIQLQHGPNAGRLVIPCDHGKMTDGKRFMYSHAFFSDDHGQTWKLGGTVAPHTDECQVVELASGELLMNMRNYWGRDGMRPGRGGKRAIARSRDSGETWSLDFDETLIEPLCQASLIGIPNPRQPGQTVLVFSNPASREARRNLTVRASFDGGKTWPVTKLIDDGSAAYSCLALVPGGRVGLLYERDDYKRIAFTDFEIEIPTK